MSILLLDLQKYKEALVGKWSRVKNPVVDTKFGLSTVRHSILTPPPNVLSISLLDLQKYKEALVGKLTQSKIPADNSASFEGRF